MLLGPGPGAAVKGLRSLLSRRATVCGPYNDIVCSLIVQQQELFSLQAANTEARHNSSQMV